MYHKDFRVRRLSLFCRFMEAVQFSVEIGEADLYLKISNFRIS